MWSPPPHEESGCEQQSCPEGWAYAIAKGANRGFDGAKLSRSDAQNCPHLFPALSFNFRNHFYHMAVHRRMSSEEANGVDELSRTR